MAVSYKKQTHRSKGKAGKIPHPSGMSPHSGARKNRLTKALREREEGIAQRKMNKNKTVPKPKRKPPVPKNQDIDKGFKTIALKKGKSISKAMGEDKTKMPEENMGPVMDSINRITEMEDKAPIPKKDKKKVKKKMGGGQVYKRGHGGKVIKNNMSGQDLVNACYDN